MVRSKSRSLSPDSKRGVSQQAKISHSHEKEKEEITERVDNFGRIERTERQRSQSPRRHRSRSPRRPRSRSRSPRRKHESSRSKRHDRSRSKEKESLEVADMELEHSDPDEEVDEETAMAKLMGFSGFDSTKGKHVVGACNLSHVKVAKPRRYRQYMNRRGGFNRPLDYVN